MPLLKERKQRNERKGKENDKYVMISMELQDGRTARTSAGNDTVQSPCVLDRNPVLVRRVKGSPQRSHCPFQDGGVSLIELKSVQLQQLSCARRLV
jgi:hypothetical protein